jgi:hypothetical protein
MVILLPYLFLEIRYIQHQILLDLSTLYTDLCALNYGPYWKYRTA